MPNINNYIEKYKNISFRRRGLTPLDVMAINEISYVALSEVVSKEFDFGKACGIKDILNYYNEHEKELKTNNILFPSKRVKLLRLMANSRRFRDIELCAYREELDILNEVQFCACIVKVPFVADFITFRGTDDNVVSWKEDFKMSYLSKIPAQKLACKYLKEALDNLNGSFILTGHSKGGNLAVYSAACVDESLRERIERIYTYDAPGVHESVVESEGYRAIKSKVIAYVPEDTVVGVLLETDVQTVVIKSKLFGVMQHIVYNWQIKGHDFDKAKKRTDGSILFEKALKQWMKNYTEEELKVICDVAFDLFADIKIVSFLEFKDEFHKKVSDLIKAVKSIDENDSKLINKAFSELMHIYISLATEKLKNNKPKFNKNKKQHTKDKISEKHSNIELLELIRSKLPFIGGSQEVDNEDNALDFIKSKISFITGSQAVDNEDNALDFIRSKISFITGSQTKDDEDVVE